MQIKCHGDTQFRVWDLDNFRYMPSISWNQCQLLRTASNKMQWLSQLRACAAELVQWVPARKRKQEVASLEQADSSGIQTTIKRSKLDESIAALRVGEV